MFQIKTARLRLIPLDAEMLEDLKKGRDILEKRLELTPSAMEVSPNVSEEMEDALEFWGEFTRAHPAQYFWGTNWEIVLDEENRSIGGIGLGGTPNKHGQVTVGYHIDPRRQGCGYATEALEALRDWAVNEPDCTSILAFTPIENVASQRVLAKCGFQLVDRVEESGIDCYFWRYLSSNS